VPSTDDVPSSDGVREPILGSRAHLWRTAEARRAGQQEHRPDYIYEVRKLGTPKQTWATFLRNHASEIWSCDFLQTYDLFFRTLFVFVIIELDSRRLVYFGVTRNPTDAWVAQRLREATPFLQGPRYLIRDNDRKYGRLFTRVASGTGIEVLRTP
jgi:hypothetical protein